MMRWRRPNDRSAQVPVSPWLALAEVGRHSSAELLVQADRDGRISDVVRARFLGYLNRAAESNGRSLQELADLADRWSNSGPALLTRSTDLVPRTARHDVETGSVKLGRVANAARNPPSYLDRDFWLDQNVLTTSMLVIGPPGSGKTRSLAAPVVQSLCLASLAERTSVLVIDVKGDDFAWPGAFDVEIDLGDPESEVGFDLYGGITDAGVAADRLAAALLPPDIPVDQLYFSDSARNALADSLMIFHGARDRFPDLGELCDMLAGATRLLQSVGDRLKTLGSADLLRRLEMRRGQLGKREDPAAMILERVRQLDRPRLRSLLSRPERFSMSTIDRPVRVRLALDEGDMPDASLFLARLAISQFVQTVSSRRSDPSISKFLVIDEAGRFVDDYVARGIERIRSRRGGFVLLTQGLATIAELPRQRLLASTGSKVVFGGISPDDAQYFSDFWGTHWRQDVSISRSMGRSVQTTGVFGQRSTSDSTQFGTQRRMVEEPLWPLGALINEVPIGHCVGSFAAPDGQRTPPLLINLRDHGAPPPAVRRW